MPRRPRSDRRREEVDIALAALHTFRGRWPILDSELADMAAIVARLNVAIAGEIKSRLWARGSQPTPGSPDFGDDFNGPA
jgi:hypothetical protein